MLPKLPLQIFKDTSAPAVALLVLVIQLYGTECFEWEPEFLRKHIEEDFEIKLTDLQADKIQAAILVLTSDDFEGSLEVFQPCCHILNNQDVGFEDFHPLEAEEIASALAQARLIVADDEDRLNFSDEVNAYCGIVFSDYGMSGSPSIMPTAIIPKTHGTSVGTDSDKNAALEQLTNARTAQLKEYLKSMVS